MDMAGLSVLTINSGSSSLKASFFSGSERIDFRYGHLSDHESAFEKLASDLDGMHPDLIGHRIVHGGNIADAARRIDKKERKRLESLIPLAPLHLPGNLRGIDLCARFGAPQIACFDTAFHARMPEISKRLPIPGKYGMQKYGFHGLNYAHIASRLPEILGDQAQGHVVAAHLGSGASLCLMKNLQSVDTTMAYTPAGGIVMGTRSGDIDPGVMLELSRRMDGKSLEHAVYHEMGLLALSGESSEMADLIESESPDAAFAIDYFCNSVRGAIGSFAAKAGGIDALVFSGGIGEHAAEIREKIVTPLSFLDFSLDKRANCDHSQRISETASKPVLVVSADEEFAMRGLCVHLVSSSPTRTR